MKNTKKKRLLSVVLSLAMMQGLCLTAYAKDATEYGLWVGGEKVTSVNLSGEGWSYDAESKTLTLDGYSSSGSVYKWEFGGYSADIYSEDELTIDLVGTNTITNKDTDPDYIYGIVTQSKLSFTGSGTLNVTAEGDPDDSVTGIYVADGGLSVEDATINADGATYGISYSGRATIHSGNVTAAGRNGIYGSSGAFVIEGGTVTAIGESAGLSCTSNLEIKEGSSLTAVGKTNEALSISGFGLLSEITGTGWTNAEGTEGKETIAVDAGEELLKKYKKVQFPEVKDPARVTKAPTAKELTANDTSQELVAPGETSDGKFVYVASVDKDNAPADDAFRENIPTATDAGTYYVWYKVIGDEEHSDSEPAYVEVKIAEAPSNDSSTPDSSTPDSSVPDSSTPDSTDTESSESDSSSTTDTSEADSSTSSSSGSSSSSSSASSTATSSAAKTVASTSPVAAAGGENPATGAAAAGAGALLIAAGAVAVSKKKK